MLRNFVARGASLGAGDSFGFFDPPSVYWRLLILFRSLALALSPDCRSLSSSVTLKVARRVSWIGSATTSHMYSSTPATAPPRRRQPVLLKMVLKP
jgi:hypothetical protein